MCLTSIALSLLTSVVLRRMIRLFIRPHYLVQLVYTPHRIQVSNRIAPAPVKGDLCVSGFVRWQPLACTITIEALHKEAKNIGLTSRNDKPISKQTLIDMLKRRANTGVFQYGGKDEWHIGTYEPLISTDLYDKIQVAMGWVKPRNHDKPAATSGRYYPYKGLFLCKTCKFNVTAYTKSKKLANSTEAEYVFYTCTKKNRKIECNERQLSDKIFEQEIENRMREFDITESDGAECSSWLDHHYKKSYQEA
jgi:hypothetical protein